MKPYLSYLTFIIIPLMLCAGCGYTTRAVLPADVSTIYIEPTVNKIDITQEVTDDSVYMKYEPFLEVDITNIVMERFIFDGTLSVTNNRNDADLILTTELVRYVKDPLRYANNEDIQEYRLSVVVQSTLLRRGEDQPLWSEQIVGDTSYFTSGTLAKEETTALNDAINDLARRIVSRTVLLW